MPTPVIAQPITIAPAPAPDAMFCGSEKMPLPIIEPITSAVSSANGNWRGAAARSGAEARAGSGVDGWKGCLTECFMMKPPRRMLNVLRHWPRRVRLTWISGARGAFRRECGVNAA